VTQVEIWQWALLALGAFIVGLSKTGVAGLGILFVVIFGSVLPARASVGVVLPILISADIVAVTAYRRHAEWHHLWRLFPWTAAGVVLGTIALGRIDDVQARKLIGAIVLAMAMVHFWRHWRARVAANAANAANARGEDALAVGIETGIDAGALDAAGPVVAAVPVAGIGFVVIIGMMAGFTTMVANAAGPVMILYLLAMRLPKLAFIGTAAWFYLAVNVFKVPFSLYLGLITFDSLRFLAVLAPFAITGALFGRVVLRYIDQKTFERLALIFSIVAGLRLLW